MVNTVAKSLGQFVASVLSVVSAATYVPASVVVGGATIAGLLATSDESNPLEAVAQSASPTFAELALFVIVVTLVASLLEPLQFKITRFFEGYSSLFPADRVTTFKDERKAISEKRNSLTDDQARLKKKVAELTKEADSAERKQVQVELATTRRDLRLTSQEIESWPRPERILPTKLGNTIRSFEDRASALLKESGIASTVPGNGEIQDLLPFAYFAIPAETREIHDRFRSQVQSLTTLVAVTPIVGLAVAGSLLHYSWGWLWGAAVLALSATIASAAHSGARSAGEGYGAMILAIAQQFASGAIDIHASEPKALETLAS